MLEAFKARLPKHWRADKYPMCAGFRGRINAVGAQRGSSIFKLASETCSLVQLFSISAKGWDKWDAHQPGTLLSYLVKERSFERIELSAHSTVDSSSTGILVCRG